MKYIRLLQFSLAVLISLAAWVGCDNSSKPPEPISAEELPAALDQTFSKAKPETKELAMAFATAVRNKDYPQAMAKLQQLTALSGMDKAQARLISRAFPCVNNLLQNAQAQGDQKAAQALQIQHLNK